MTVCGSELIRKHGHKKSGKRIYDCLNHDCSHKNFVEEYRYNDCNPETRNLVLTMSVNGIGTRAIARSLGISKDTVTSILKKNECWVEQVNTSYINAHSDEIAVDIVSGEELEINVNEVEMDEMWSFVHDKSQQYWLWWAIDHNTGEPLAYTFGTREHKYLDELIKLLTPFKINTVYSDDNFAYKKHVKESIVVTGKRNTQKIERHHLSLRTWCSRLVRKGIRFSKTHQMHRIVVGMVINFWLFGKKLFKDVYSLR
jgi:IS1 family transposase/transposase-like protein